MADPNPQSFEHSHGFKASPAPVALLPWLVLERTGDPAMAGTVAAASALPGAIAAFAGGHLIDKIGRRRMTVLSDIGSALAVAATSG